MSELWYWKSNDRVRGPLVTEELEAIVLRQRLADADSVRLDGSDEWIPAADIRSMFLSSATVSPADAAAKLLENAAVRRVQATTAARETGVLGRIAERLAEVMGGLAGSLSELVSRGVQAGVGWLGRSGRVIVTLLAAAAVLVFVGSRVRFTPRDSTRLTQIEEIWKLIQANASGGAPLSQEAVDRLETIQKDLEVSLREQPVSGTSGARRQSSLARREMLFAVRDIRDAQHDLDERTRTRIDRQLQAASDLLRDPERETPTPRRDAQTRWSKEVVAVLVIDSLLVLVVAGWWVMGRGRG